MPLHSVRVSSDSRASGERRFVSTRVNFYWQIVSINRRCTTIDWPAKSELANSCVCNRCGVAPTVADEVGTHIHRELGLLEDMGNEVLGVDIDRVSCELEDDL